MLSIGVDTGGTFTDFIVFDEDAGTVRVEKTPSTPSDPTIAFMQGLDQMGIDMKQVRKIVHGMTIATNAIIERKGAKVGVLVTEGHRDVIEMGQLRRYGEPGAGLWDTRWQRPEPYVARHLRHEIPERMLYTGEVLKKLEDEDVLAAIQKLKEQEVESVAVCYINSYVNADHEKRSGALVEEHLPDTHVSLSVETVPEYREFERWSTTILNAYVSPVIGVYLERLSDTLRGKGFEGDLFYMTSGGGVLTEGTAPQYPIRFLLSGPAAGVQGGVYLGDATGERNIITYDMGGTSTDISLIKDLSPIITHERNFEGAPVKTPQLDISTIGAGGGSIAWVSDEGGVRVGPQSAGAAPGPVCYGRGGTEVTVTDANLVLGRMDAGTMLGGAMTIDKSLAEKALAELGKKVGVSDMYELAEGVVRICINNMCGAVRTVSIERGFDPRDFALMPMGGAGAMHAIPVADELGIDRVLVPPDPGNACAFGLLATDLKHDYSRTYVVETDEADVSRIRSLWAEMEKEGRDALSKEGLDPSRISVALSGDMRYLGQSWQLNVALTDRMEMDEIVSDFHDVYKEVYGYSRPGMTVELVYLRVVASGEVDKPQVKASVTATKQASDAIKHERDVYFDGSFAKCKVYDRSLLAPGATIEGPALIEEYGASTVLFPNWRAKVDTYGNMSLTRKG